jgi:diguanylate cyclase (GGDEF)-like protein
VDTQIRNVIRLFILLWTVVLGVSIVWNLYLVDVQVLQIAKIQASAFIDKDLTFRLWASSHGGVYVKPTEQTPPNPYLKAPKRDVVTTDGMVLTLMNPAYIAREVNSRFAEKFGVRGHITSLNSINPANAPDAWERAGLERFAAGDLADYYSVNSLEDKPFLRMLKPMIMQPECLTCHAWTGVPVGGVRGGIAAVVPLEPLRRSVEKLQWHVALSNLVIWLTGAFGLAWFGRRAQRQHNERVKSEVERRVLYQQATHDALTGLFNRRYLDEVLPRELLRMRRAGEPLSVAFLDIDHFKRFNDEYGHEAGDEVLRTLGAVLSDFLRKSDIACRYGGEELFIIMPDTCASDVLPRMEALRQRVRTTRIHDRRGRALPEITISIGVVSSRAGDCGVEDLLSLVDQALYQAKAGGRDQVLGSELE